MKYTQTNTIRATVRSESCSSMLNAYNCIKTKSATNRELISSFNICHDAPAKMVPQKTLISLSSFFSKDGPEGLRSVD